MVIVPGEVVVGIFRLTGSDRPVGR